MESSADNTSNCQKGIELIERLINTMEASPSRAVVKRKKRNIEWYRVFKRIHGKQHFRDLLHINHTTFYLLTRYLYQYGGEAVNNAKNMDVSFATVVCRGVLYMASRATVTTNAKAMNCSKTAFIKSVDLFIQMLLHVKDRVICIPTKENFRFFKSNAGEVFKGAVLAIGILIQAPIL